MNTPHQSTAITEPGGVSLQWWKFFDGLSAFFRVQKAIKAIPADATDADKLAAILSAFRG